VRAVGKEVVARMIHLAFQSGGRSVCESKLRCAAGELLEIRTVWVRTRCFTRSGALEARKILELAQQRHDLLGEIGGNESAPCRRSCLQRIADHQYSRLGGET